MLDPTTRLQVASLLCFAAACGTQPNATPASSPALDPHPSREAQPSAEASPETPAPPMAAPTPMMIGSAGAAPAQPAAAPTAATPPQSQPQREPEPESEPAMSPSDTNSADAHTVQGNSARGNALTLAYEALRAGDRSRAEAIVDAVDSQVAADPTDSYAIFYAAALRLWLVAETYDVAPMTAMLENFKRAHELLPNDFRVTSFYGLGQVVVGGAFDPEMLEDGLDTLKLGIAQQSTYGHFLRAVSVSILDPSHPAFQTAFDDMTGVEKDCHVQVDANGTYQYPTDKRTDRSRICANEGIVPHSWEGYFANFGDIALKSGLGAERARAIYRSAQTSPTYATWPFKEVLEKRIADADKAAAAYADADPLNNPTVWALDGNICLGCHQEK